MSLPEKTPCRAICGISGRLDLEVILFGVMMQVLECDFAAHRQPQMLESEI